MRKALILTVAAVLVMVMGSASAGAQPAFMEDFEDGDVAGWGASQPGPSGNGTFEAVATPVSPSGGNYVGKQTFGVSCWGWSYSFDPATPDYVSWYFRADGDTEHSSGVALGISDGAGWVTFISYHQGALRYFSGAVYNQITPASMGTWYLIELRNIDWDSDTFDIWVDGVEKVVGAASYDPVDGVAYFSNYACPFASGPSYVDDITFGFDSPPVGGIAEVLVGGGEAPVSTGAGSGSSSLLYAAIVGSTAAAVALAGAGWYARRRWLR